MVDMFAKSLSLWLKLVKKEMESVFSWNSGSRAGYSFPNSFLMFIKCIFFKILAFGKDHQGV